MSKTIIITGANGGLGTAVTEKFLNAGYRVIGATHSDRQSELARNHPMYEHHVVNVVNEAEAEKFVNGVVEQHKIISGALLLVGGFRMGGIEKTTGEDIKYMFRQNFESAFYILKPLYKHMSGQNYGRIALVSAQAGVESEMGHGSVGYALSKALLVKLAGLVNAAAKGKDVVCSVVAPGTINTAQNRNDMPDQDPAKWVQPEQLAEVFEFICSDRSAAVRDPLYKVYGAS